MKVRPRALLLALPILLLSGWPAAAGPYGEGLGEMGGASRLIEALRRLDAPPPEKPRARSFPIREFRVEGSTRYTPEVLNATLRQFRGDEKTVEDVEEARAYLQREFERVGYPTMIVTIPEQTIKDGIIRFRMVEAKVDRIEVTGNRHYSDDRILGYFPDLRPGEPLYAPGLTQALDRVNENPDHQVSPVLKPGAKPGTTNLELKVKEKSPWHGRLQLSNTGTANTPDLRTTAMLSYANLWGREHVASVTAQTAPEEVNDVKVIGASYLIPIRRWNHALSLYASYSDSQSGFTLAGLTGGVNATNVGKGTILGARYTFPIFSIARWKQRMFVGIEYKDQDQVLEVGTGTDTAVTLETPVRYLPFNIGYEGTATDRNGFTRAYATLNVNFAGTLPVQNFGIDFNRRRAGSTGDWAYAVLGLSRTQRLWKDWSLRAIVDGQIAGKPLIDAEQFGIGGATSVRGFMERVVLGDNGFHVTGELVTPNFGKKLPTREKVDLQGLAFVDFGRATTFLPDGQTFGSTNLASAGIGLRLAVWNKVFANLDYGIPFQGQQDVVGLDQDGLRPFNFSLTGQF